MRIRNRSLLEAIAHADLSDMPDVGGTNTDHDARYYKSGDSPLFTNITLSGASLLADATAVGILTLGGTGGTNNNTLAFDFDADAYEVTMTNPAGRLAHLGRDTFSAFELKNNSGNGGMEVKNSYDVAESYIAVDDIGGNMLILTNYDNRNTEHAHAVQTNPTLFIHSDESPTTAPNDYLALYHDQTDAHITTGAGDLKLSAAGGDVSFSEANLTNVGDISHDDATASDFTISNLDQDKDILFNVNDGGLTYTGIKIDASNEANVIVHKNIQIGSVAPGQITAGSLNAATWTVPSTIMQAEFNWATDGTFNVRNIGAGNAIFQVNSTEIVGADSVVNKSVVEDSGNWDTAFGWGNHASANYASKIAANTHTAGTKNTFQSSATTAGLNLGGLAGNPSGAAKGDVWYNTSTDRMMYYGTSSREVVARTLAQTLTTKTIALGSNTVSGTKAQFDTACTDGNFAYSGGAFHDGFSDFVAAEHYDWTNETHNFLTTGTLNTGAATFGDGGTTNYASFSAAGVLSYAGSAYMSIAANKFAFAYAATSYGLFYNLNQTAGGGAIEFRAANNPVCSVMMSGIYTGYLWERYGVMFGTSQASSKIISDGSLGSSSSTLYIGDEAIATSDGTTGGTGSAGSGNQYVNVNIGGTVYKLLHD